MSTDIESLLNGLTVPISGGGTIETPDSESQQTVNPSNMRSEQSGSSGTAVSLHNAIDSLRSDLLSDAIDRCIAILSSHRDVTFEMSDFLRYAIILKTGPVDVANKMREELALTLTQSLLSLYADEPAELVKNGNQIAAHAHLIALLLQNPGFSEHAMGNLKDASGELLNFVRPRGDQFSEKTPWVAYILLIMERLCSECFQPQKIEWTTSMSEAERLQLLSKSDEPFLSADTQNEVFELVINLLPRVNKDTQLALQVSRLLAILTKSLQLANAMSQMQNLQKLFLMIKQLAGLKADKVHSLVILILRHVLEDTETLTQIMRTEIAQCFEARISQRSQMDVTHYVRTMSHLILRQPEIFMSVTTELVKIPRLDSIVNAHLRSHTLVLKSTPSGDAPAGTTESNQKHISIQDRSNELTAVEESLSSPGLKLLVPNVPDGLIHFMISEVCNCPQAEEPSTDRHPGPSIDASREDADMGVKGHSSSLSEDSAQMKKAPEFKADQHPIYVYQCFLLASLTELLASYNSAKNAFVTYQRRPMSIELPTSVKSKARFLPYLLNELLPMESIEYISHEDIPGCKRKITSKWAMAAVAALCAKTGEKGFDRANDSSNGEDEPELLAVRRYALDQIQKAYRECEQISVLAMRYAKVLALSDLVYNILESPPSSGGGSSMAELLTISQKQLARLMFEKNYIRSFTDSLADMDFTFPMIERVVKYVLKTIKVLTDRVYQLSLTSSLARAEAQEVGEPSSTSSATDSDRTREETPDLFRHSALGILDPAQNESSTSISEGEDDNEMYGDEYEEELDYDDPMDDEDEDDENDEMASDDSQEMEGVSGEIPTDMEFHTGGQHDSTSDEAASLNSEEVDQDEEDVAMIDMDENSDWQGEDIDDSGIPMATGDDEYGNEDGVFEHSSSDGGGHAVASNLPINSLMESLHAEFEPMLDHPQDHTADPEFSDDDDVMVVEDEEHYSEMDEDEEMDYDEGDMDDEGEDDIFLPPPGPILLPPQHMYFDPDDEDIALGNTGHQHAPRVITQGTRHQRGGHPWLTYDNGDPLLVPNYRTAAIHRGPHAEEANPLLQPEHDLSPVVGQSGSSIPFPGGSADLSRLITTMMANRPQGPMDNRGNILDNLLSHLRDGSGIGVHRHNGTLHFSISGEPRGLVPDFQAVLGGPTPFHEPISSARDPLMTFCPCVTSSRWGEEARLLYGAATIDMARRTENTLRATLVPLAILDEQERKKTAEEERKVDEIKQKRQAEEEAEANRKAEEDKAAEEARRAAEEQTALALTGSDLSQEPPHPMVDFGSELTVGHGGSNVSAHEAGVLTRSPTDNHTTEASLPVERVVTSLRGQELDITGMDIDPGFLEALPDELREEVLMQHISERRQREAASGGQPTEINREFLNALPTDIREEVLRTEAQERRRQERAAAQQASPTQQRQAAEMDPASFLASLQPELRQTVLAEGDDEFIDQLPPDLAAEARALRRPRRAPNFDDPYLSAIDPNAGGDALTMTVPQEPTKVSVVRMLDQQGMASLLRLLFLPQDRHQSSTLSLILLSAVNNRQDREEMLGLILGLLNGITVDEVSAEKVYTQLALRAKEGDRGDKIASPATIATGQASPLSSLTLTQRCLQALLTLAGQHNRVPMFFLTEHDNHLALQPETKRGKGRSAKILRHPINTLLSLLERALLTESNGAMETYSTLLSIITTPLRNLYDRSAARTPTELPGLITEANDSTVTTGGAGAGLATTSSVPQSTGPDLSMQSVDSAQSASEAANTQEVVGTTNESAKKAESLVVVRKPVPPVIPDHNLRLVVSVLAGRECSSNTFKQTLQSMESLLYVPGAVTVFGSELVKQAQLLASTTLISLNDMVSEMKRSASELELQIIRFSTASLDQTKLLRVLTALDFLFDAKKQALFNPEGSDRPDLVRPNLVAPLFVMPEFVSLWQRLGECLTIIREKENSQNLAAVLLPLIESLMVVCQNTTIKDQANLQAPTDRVVVSSPPPESQMEHLFYTFTEEHRKVLNSLVRSNPRLMSGSFALLVKNPKVLEFDNKRNYFSRQMHGRAGGIRQNYHSLSLNIRRDHVFMDTYRSMYFKSADEIKYAKLNIRFNGEEGVDAGGVTREWFSALSRQMFNPDYALFSPVAGDRTTFHPNKSSSVNDEHLLYFKFIGRIIGKVSSGRLSQ